MIQKNKRRLLLGILLAVGILGVGARVANSFMQPSHELGVVDGLLAACPESPNCVSTQSDSEEHTIAPLKLTEPAADALRRLETIISKMSRTKVVRVDNNYLHAEFRTFWLGYIDDVEFYVDESAGLIHFRSASRVGYSDLGVNRARMEKIRRRFERG